MNDWDKVEDVVFEGSRVEIEQLKCPECGGHIRVLFDETLMSLKVQCEKCKSYFRESNCFEIPKFLQNKNR